MMIDRSSIEARDAIRADLSEAVNAFLEQGNRIVEVKTQQARAAYNIRKEFRLPGSPTEPKRSRREEQQLARKKLELEQKRMAALEKKATPKTPPHNKKHVSEETIELIREEALKGYSKLAVSKRLGISRELIIRVSRENSIYFSNSLVGAAQKAIADKARERRKELAQQMEGMKNMGYKHIAKQLGISVKQCWIICNEFHLDLGYKKNPYCITNARALGHAAFKANRAARRAETAEKVKQYTHLHMTEAARLIGERPDYLSKIAREFGLVFAKHH